jgi:hypothetical protein
VGDVDKVCCKVDGFVDEVDHRCRPSAEGLAATVFQCSLYERDK